MKKLAVLGASGHGKVVAEIAELLGWEVSFFDDSYPEIQLVEGLWSVKGNTDDLCQNLSSYNGCFIAIGDNSIRLQKMNKFELLGVEIPSLIHPKAVVSQYAKIKTGTVVMANAVLNPFVCVGKGCIINTSSSIDHDCKLSDGVHVSPGVNLAGAVTIGSHTWIGIGATVKQCVQIGSHVIVGSGASVVANLPDSVTAVGVPAKVQFDSFGK